MTKFCINIWYWIYSLCLKICQNYIQLFNKSTFFSCFCDDFDIRWVWNFQFDVFLQLIWKWIVQSNRRFFSTFATIFTSILRIRIARFVDNRFCWFCQCLIRQSIEIHFITRFRYSFYENIFFSEFVTILSIFISSKSFTLSKQQKLKITFEVSKIVKQNKFKKIFKTEQIVKLTSTFQNIDIFYSTLALNEFEFDLYKEIANFLQHFQQCRHQYRKSNFLNLLSNCLCDFAFKWFEIQFEFISLKRFSKILTKTFSKAFIRRFSRNLNFQLNASNVVSKSIENASDQQIVKTICKFCKQNFNFNNELYEHIRKHEILKFVENFHFSINAINLIISWVVLE